MTAQGQWADAGPDLDAEADPDLPETKSYCACLSVCHARAKRDLVLEEYRLVDPFVS